MSNKHFPTSYESKFWNWYFIIPPYFGAFLDSQAILMKMDNYMCVWRGMVNECTMIDNFLIIDEYSVHTYGNDIDASQASKW